MSGKSEFVNWESGALEQVAVSQQPALDGRLLSVAIPTQGISAYRFLAQAKGLPRFYWADSKNGATFAGLGIAADLRAWGSQRFAAIENQARQLFQYASSAEDMPEIAAPRLFGGFAFRPDFTPDNTWSIYPPAQFVLPHFQLFSDGDTSWLTINAMVPEEDDPQDAFSDLRKALTDRLVALHKARPEMDAATTPRAIHYPMPYADWEQMIKAALNEIHAGTLEKVVLARACEVRLEERIELMPILRYLDDTYQECYRFLFEPRPYHAFFGATPELLIHATGRTISTIGLAGSAPRGGDEERDNALGQGLLTSAKDRWEHQVVVDAIRSRLTPLTERLTIAAQPHLLRLHNIQHLETSIYGTLKERIGVLPLVEQLHPTPALGGNPREEALAFISDKEPVPRGWYAAPVGMIDNALDGTFTVAIRSAVAEKRRVWLYAGVGIVDGSDPQREWEETDLKFRPMLNALGAT